MRRPAKAEPGKDTVKDCDRLGFFNAIFTYVLKNGKKRKGRQTMTAEQADDMSKQTKQPNGPTYYKVLLNGTSCHGGTHKWSLPKGNRPGKWHKVTSVSICNTGFHLTTEPARWFSSAKHQVFVARGRGKSATEGDKTAFAEAQLVRLVKASDLASIGIFVDGASGIVSGSSTATLYGSSTATLYGSSTATLYESSTATLYGSSTAIRFSRRVGVELIDLAILIDRSEYGVVKIYKAGDSIPVEK